MAKADLKHYEDAQGRVFSLNESDARLLNYSPTKLADHRVTSPPAAGGATREAAEQNAALTRRVTELEERLAAVAKEQADAKAGTKGR